MTKDKKTDLMIWGSVGSLGTTVVLLVLKTIAFMFTGSVAILSSLFDSVQDFMTSLINMVSVYQAVRPADKNHRFGHGKAQGIGGLLQSFIIAASALLLLIESVSHIFKHEPVQQIGFGIIVILISIVLSSLLVWFQNYIIRQTRSVSIKADRAHYAGDAMMNAGVLLSLFATKFLGWAWIDGAFGVLVAIYLFHTVWQIMKEACALLMDGELDSQIRQDIKKIVLNTHKVLGVSDLRTREGGNKTFAQFNVQFDGRLSLNSAHSVLDKLEEKIKRKYPDMEVIIHAEPVQKGSKKWKS